MKFLAFIPFLLNLSPQAASDSLLHEAATMHATGTFEVKVHPENNDNPRATGAGLNRLSLEKRFHGPLEGTSTGEMLAFGDGTQSGAYVAIEKIEGTLQGREGTFALAHRAMMTRGTPHDWTIMVVAESGTGGLAGISGSMTITIVDGKHHYDLAYSLADERAL